MLRLAGGLGCLVLVAGCGGPGSVSAEAPGPAPTPVTAAAAARPGWATTAAAPLSARAVATAVWTGREVLVFGGRDRGGGNCNCPKPVGLRDGAAYDPVADAWRPIAEAPDPIGGAWAVVGDGVVHVLATPALGPQQRVSPFLAYDVAADRWRKLKSPPPQRAGLMLGSAGGTLVAYRDSDEAGGRDFVWDAEGDRWRALPATAVPMFDRRLVDLGGEGVLIGREMPVVRGPIPDGVVVARLGPDTRRWKVLRTERGVPARRIEADGSPWWPVGGRAVGSSFQGRVAGGPMIGGAFDPARGWRRLPARPDLRDDRDFAWMRAAGGGYVVAGRWALHVPTRTWTKIPRRAGAPSGYDAAPAVTWAGDRLFVWGGAQHSNPVSDAGWTWRPRLRY